MYIVSGIYSCRDDYMKRFAPPCYRCMQPILDDHVSAFGHDWHQHCFVCCVSVGFLS